MRKIVLIFAFVMSCCLTTMSQVYIDARTCCNVYRGKPQTVVVSNNGFVSKATFDNQGRITSVEVGMQRMEFKWRSDGKRITVKGYNNGELLATEYINVSVNTAEQLAYSAGGADYEFNFEPNGRANDCKISFNGMTQSMYYRYASDDDIYPIYIEGNASGQTMRTDIEILETDSYGNAIKYVMSANGMEQVFEVQITYY